MSDGRKIMVSLCGAVLTVVSLALAQTYTYSDLARRLVDLERLAAPPPTGETGALASSYDRASKYDAETGKYVKWDANGDNGGVIRMEGEMSVFAEIEGPGVIWRAWSAAPGDGHVKIYLDGAAEPAVDLPFKGYFNQRAEPFTRPLLVYKTEAQGFNNYTPIPFQKSCKIVAAPGWGQYYLFNYTRFPAGTTVPTFKLPLAAEDAAALDEANKIFAAVGSDPAGERVGATTETKTLTVPAGGTATVAEFAGAGAITGLRVTIKDMPADLPAQRTLLARLTVSAAWDGAAKPAVWSQLGDFFGAAAAPEPFRTLPVGRLDEGTFYSYWYMPFGDGARLEVGNDGPAPVTMTWEVTKAPLAAADAAKLSRFHAKWHRDAFLPAEPEREIDWTILLTKGRGRFVGVALHLWNPGGGWWGEGDEKFFVDGEKFPSTIGTGSEDYFGYAWCDPHRFIRPLHAQPVNEENEGHANNLRWHIADNVPFQKSFEGAIEKYFRGSTYSATAYWYLNADGDDRYEPVPWAEREPLATPAVFRVPGVIEGEKMSVPRGALARQQTMNNPSWQGPWSGLQQVFWHPPADGEKLALGFKVERVGKYRVAARCTKAADYGIVQFGVNGAPLGAPVDCYAPRVTAADEIELGEVSLPAGENTLNVTGVGKNEQSRDWRFGLDYLKLTPVE